MQVTPINCSYNQTFEGRLIPKGKWTPSLLKSFENNSEIQKLISGEYDIVAKMNRQIAKKNEYYFKGTPLYSLTLSAEKPNLSFIEKFKNFFKSNKELKVAQNYHTEDGLLSIIDVRANAEKYKKILGI